MRKHILSISLMSMLLIAATSVAYSYYNEAKRTVISGEEISDKEECDQSDETPWETLTKKIVGFVTM